MARTSVVLNHTPTSKGTVERTLAAFAVRRTLGVKGGEGKPAVVGVDEVGGKQTTTLAGTKPGKKIGGAQQKYYIDLALL